MDSQLNYITLTDIENALVPVPCSAATACRGIDKRPCVASIHSNIFSFTAYPPLEYCVLCLINTQLLELTDIACTYRRWIARVTSESPENTTYTFSCKPSPSWFAFDYSTIPVAMGCMSMGITVPLFHNTPMILPAVHTALITKDNAPRCVLLASIQQTQRTHLFYSPACMHADMALLLHPLSAISTGSVASIKSILAARIRVASDSSQQYNAMTSARIVASLNAIALLSSIETPSAPSYFLRAAADPICQHPVTSFWRASIAHIAIQIAFGAAGFPSLHTTQTTITQYNSIRSQAICPAFASSVAAVLFSDSIFSSDDPLDDPDDGVLSIDYSRWSWCTLVDVICDYHVTSHIPVPLTLASNPHRHMTTNVLIHMMSIITASPYSSITHATPRSFPDAYTTKVINIDIGHDEPRVTVPFCKTCNLSSINIFKSVAAVRQRSTISVVLDPIRGAYICDACYTVCTQLQLTRHIIAPVNISTLIKSYVMNNVGVYPSGLTRASQKYKQTMMAVWRPHKRYIPRLNGSTNSDGVFVNIPLHST